MANKKVLIISPCFPPVNAADMHRVRTSLPYFEQFGWYAEVVIVDEQYIDMAKDELLLQSVHPDIKIHKVSAFSKKWTSKIGLGSIALRSLWFCYKKVSRLLKTGNYDLIYFSTTQFPVCVLGALWKRKFGIPYVIDMQDPWHSEYYRNKPKKEQPPKYWFSYRLNKYLEPVAMQQVDGLISVSDNYITDLKNRYLKIKDIPAATITFGTFEHDVAIALRNAEQFKPLLDSRFKNIVYVGRGGADMHRAITPLFAVLAKGIAIDADRYNKLRFYFIGTSYAPAGQGRLSIMPLAAIYGVDDQVVEITDRIGYYHTLATLQQADALFIPGSDDPKYTASKLYPYLLSAKPLLTIFHSKSSALNILNDVGAKHIYSFDATNNIHEHIESFLNNVIAGNTDIVAYNNEVLAKHSARYKTGQQCEIFNQVINA